MTDALTTLLTQPWAIPVMLGVGYLLSLWLHPYTKCEACKGTGRHSGAVFGYAYRPCQKCSGGSRKQRLGARLLGFGEPRVGRSRFQDRTGGRGRR